MHPTQKAILSVFGNEKTIPLKLRWITREVGEKYPQTIKHHLHQLEKNGLIAMDFDTNKIIKINLNNKESVFLNIPIMGTANCGIATAFAENLIEGYFKISKSLLPRAKFKNLFVLKAKGDSMNRANDLEGGSIEDGDYVIVEKTLENPSDKDVVVSIIDNCSNIKRYFKKKNEIILASDSKFDYPPIFIHQDDKDFYQFVGKVLRVIKHPKFKK